MVSGLYFIAGVVITYLFSRPGLDKLEKVRRSITWRAFTRAVQHCIVEIEGSRWRPDIVIGLNSGIVPASIVALNLRVPNVLFYDSLPRYIGGSRRAEVVVDKGIDLSGKEVLLIDDQAYTGRSIERLYEHLISNAKAEPQRIRRHVLFTHESGAGPIELEIPPYDHVRGTVKQMPWVISATIKPFWENRDTTPNKN